LSSHFGKSARIIEHDRQTIGLAPREGFQRSAVNYNFGRCSVKARLSLCMTRNSGWLISLSSGCGDGVFSQLAVFEERGSIVIRTIWIAALCLAGLGGLFATRVTASISEGAARDPAMVGTSFAQDTLTKADRLDLTYLRYPAENVPAAPTEPIAADIVPTKTTTSAKTASLRPPGLSAHRNAVVLPKPRPKIRPAKNARDVANASVDLKACHKQNGLRGMLISLSGAPRCEL
jgi:hypothetical protein